MLTHTPTATLHRYDWMPPGEWVPVYRDAKGGDWCVLFGAPVPADYMRSIGEDCCMPPVQPPGMYTPEPRGDALPEPWLRTRLRERSTTH